MAKPRCWTQTRCEPQVGSDEATEYRFVLEYELRDRAGLPPLVLLQLNPSTAGEAESDSGDATTRRVANWAWRRHAYGSVVFLNLFARRGNPPAAALLGLSFDEVVGARPRFTKTNDQWILDEITAPGATVVVAWGST